MRARMIEHDEQVGSILKKLKDLGVEDNTIVIYSTDDGFEFMICPDGGYAPYRGEKALRYDVVFNPATALPSSNLLVDERAVVEVRRG